MLRPLQIPQPQRQPFKTKLWQAARYLVQPEVSLVVAEPDGLAGFSSGRRSKGRGESERPGVGGFIDFRLGSFRFVCV